MWLERCPQAELRGRPIPGCGCTTPIHILLVAAAALSMSFQCVTSYFTCWCRKISRSWKGALFFSQFEDTAHYVGKGVAARHLITLNLQPKGRDECFPLSLLSSPPLFLLFLFFFLLLLLPPPLPSLLFFFFIILRVMGPAHFHCNTLLELSLFYLVPRSQAVGCCCPHLQWILLPQLIKSLPHSAMPTTLESELSFGHFQSSSHSPWVEE